MKRFLIFLLLTSIAFAQDVTPKAQQIDNFPIKKAKGGVVLGSDHVAGIHYLRSKGVFGPDSSVTDVSPANPLPVWGSLGFALNLAAGNITGLESINKFGRNTDVDAAVTADIWDGGKTVGALPAGTSLIWVAPTAAAVHNIVSTSASDDGAPVGVGARIVRVYGLPRWTSAEISEDIILNGVGDVATDSSYVIIHRMEVLTKGATNVNVGTITATATAPSATTVTARIEVGKGQTQMAIRGIPSIKTAYIGRIYANINKAPGAAALTDIALLANTSPDTELINFLVKHTFGLQTVGTSAFTISYYTPKVIAGPAIIKMQAFSGTADMDVSAGFDLILVNN